MLFKFDHDPEIARSVGRQFRLAQREAKARANVVTKAKPHDFDQFHAWHRPGTRFVHKAEGPKQRWATI